MKKLGLSKLYEVNSNYLLRIPILSLSHNQHSICHNVDKNKLNAFKNNNYKLAALMQHFHKNTKSTNINPHFVRNPHCSA